MNPAHIAHQAEHATRRLGDARLALARWLGSDNTAASQQLASGLTDHANAIARAEGSAEMWGVAAAVADHYPDDPARVLTALIHALRTDDTWSGRGNDTRRAHFDGKLSTLHEIAMHVDIERGE